MATARPNILIALADDWSFGHAGAYDCAWVRMPHFDRIAREGVLFSRAYTPNAKCAPSRASILTGRNPWQLKEAANHGGYFPLEYRTFPEALTDSGYRCGLTGKGWAPGVALQADGRPRNLIGTSFDTRRASPPTPDIAEIDYAGNFADFLNAGAPDQPWFFWYGSLEPHRSYTYGSGASLGGKRLEDIDHVPGIWPDTPAVRHDLLDYAFECEHFDRHLGCMLEELDRRGLAENTLILVTSDNGMPFPRAKGQEYEISNHLPLAIRWPGGVARPGRSVDDFVSFIDFAPTFLAIAGIEWIDSGLAASPGRSLLPLLASTRSGVIDPTRDHMLIGKERHDIGRPADAGYPIRGLRQGDWLYLRNFAAERWPAGNPETGYLNCDGSPTKTEILKTRILPGQHHYWERAFGLRPAEELYHATRDPDCLENLAGRPEYGVCRDALRVRLLDALAAQSDPRALGAGDVFDRYPPAVPGWAGFYERWMRGEARVPDWVNASDFERIDCNPNP